MKARRRAKSYEGHKCGFCPKIAYGLCSVCFPPGSIPMFAICGPSTGRNCMQVNSNGIPHRTIMHKRQPKAEETVSGRQAVPPRPVEASGVRA